jgi:hypothetical protein
MHVLCTNKWRGPDQHCPIRVQKIYNEPAFLHRIWQTQLDLIVCSELTSIGLRNALVDVTNLSSHQVEPDQARCKQILTTRPDCCWQPKRDTTPIHMKISR